jgi:hypothetical protein
MIYVRIEMWPGGDKNRARLLGEGTITNVGSGERAAGNYEIRLAKSPEYAKPANVGKPWRIGVISGFPRQRLGPWDLLLRCLAVCVGGRNRGHFDSAATLGDERPLAESEAAE